ncbi:UDP-2,3-diacylglucosamine hydrolase [Natronocella acetinitrilica]|uniref:UDP-2,3-diacylglucosamine hydrolase n=1 Tax=Natronocella acetinitrilica TaxID=414046 RepID=A0AAE3KDC6_9GAMM|nr:UDP-2,3-diacylglucosamine diphosphatase [Natronocella acetinitrilica]MCP1676714.1 UDP-2,3-diacylglucosamine hydrolase [Natronocella acetinitrilica]
MKPVLFISDLHLDPARPAITKLFLEFLQTRATQAEALYILGDFFEAWIGDDAVPPEHPVLAGLALFTRQAGVPLYVMRGNRDFLLGDQFAANTGAVLLPDPTTIELGGERVLLMHGDSLCTDDHDYQQFRAMVHDPGWQQQFLAVTIEQRLQMAKQARQESTARNAHLASTSEYIMDVNQQAVETTMREHGVRRLVHGHTHRPNVHALTIDGESATRIVLGDWYDQGSVLEYRDGEWDLQTIPLEKH